MASAPCWQRHAHAEPVANRTEQRKALGQEPLGRDVVAALLGDHTEPDQAPSPYRAGRLWTARFARTATTAYGEDGRELGRAGATWLVVTP